MGSQSSQLVRPDDERDRHLRTPASARLPTPKPEPPSSPPTADHPITKSSKESRREAKRLRKEERARRRARKEERRASRLLRATLQSSHLNSADDQTDSVPETPQVYTRSRFESVNMDGSTGGSAPTAQMYPEKLVMLAEQAGREAASMQPYNQSHSTDNIDPRLNGFEPADKSNSHSTNAADWERMRPLLEATSHNDDAPVQPTPPSNKKGRRGGKKKDRAQMQQDTALEGLRALTEADEQLADSNGKRKRDATDVPEDENNIFAASLPPKPKRRRKKGQEDENAEPRELPSAGPLVAVEIDRVERFIEQYRVANGLTDQDINNMVQDKGRERNDKLNTFWEEVYAQLPHRDARSVRLSTRRRHHNFVNRGPWKPNDDAQLRELYAQKPNGWTYIGEVMQRMPDDCKDRWQNYLSCGDARKIGEWTEKEEIELAMAVEECKRKVRDEAKAKSKKEGRAFRDDRDWLALISFKVVSEKLGRSRSGLQCRQHWKVMARRDALEEQKRENGLDEMTQAAKKQKLWRQKQAEENYKHMLPGDKYALLNQIQESETRSEEKIPWRMLTASVPDSKWSTMDRKVAWEAIKNTVDAPPTLQEHVAALKQWFEENYADLASLYDGPVKGANEKMKREARKSQVHAEREARAAAEATSDGLGPDAVSPALAHSGPSARTSRKYKSSEMITESDHEGDGDAHAKFDDHDDLDSSMAHPYQHARSGHWAAPAGGDDDDDGDNDMSMAAAAALARASAYSSAVDGDGLDGDPAQHEEEEDDDDESMDIERG